MSEASAFWKAVKRRSKIGKRHRVASALKKLPTIELYCVSHGIAVKTLPHGFQFCKNEYVINWYPSTNCVTVQYKLPNDGGTYRFTAAGQYNRPRILIALEEVVQLAGMRSGQTHTSPV